MDGLRGLSLQNNADWIPFFNKAQIPSFISVFMLSLFGRNNWDVIVFLSYLVPPKHILSIQMETSSHCNLAPNLF